MTQLSFDPKGKTEEEKQLKPKEHRTKEATDIKAEIKEKQQRKISETRTSSLKGSTRLKTRKRGQITNVRNEPGQTPGHPKDVSEGSAENNFAGTSTGQNVKHAVRQLRQHVPFLKNSNCHNPPNLKPIVGIND